MSIVELYNDCSKFVEETCRGRDPSHGWNHMRNVADLSLEICGEMDIRTNITELAVVVAWLHDVADHKYDSDGTLRKRVREYIASKGLSDRIMDIIDNVSWSHEKKMNGEYVSYGPQLQPQRLELTADEFTALCIVRDADRLEALGAQGVERCVEYNKEVYLRERGVHIQPADLARQIRKHADEKLLKLASKYIVTPAGRRRAQTRHDEFLAALIKFEEQCLGK